MNRLEKETNPDEFMTKLTNDRTYQFLLDQCADGKTEARKLIAFRHLRRRYWKTWRETYLAPATNSSLKENL